MKELPIKKYVIIGSWPIQHRYCKDIDVICFKNDVTIDYTPNDHYSGSFIYNSKRIELLFADDQPSFQQILNNHTTNENAYLWELYAIKRGHIHIPNKHWDKHIHDLHYIKALCGSLTDENSSLVKLHKQSTNQRVKHRTPKLIGVTKDDFFDDNVKKFYEHDNIHWSMKHGDKPMFMHMQINPGSVECLKHLWDNFSTQEKDWCVLEEAYVIALEREIIPTEMGIKVGKLPFLAFKWALMRICTNLCSGWFRDWAIDNYFRILNQYDADYIVKFWKNINTYQEKVEYGKTTES